jgi:hypothetical protein
MYAEIEKRRRELVALCRRHGVERLEAFGSAVRAGDIARESRDEFGLDSNVLLLKLDEGGYDRIRCCTIHRH